MADKDRVRILVISHAMPWPPNQGSKVATLGLIRALASEFDVTLLSRIVSKEDLAHVAPMKAWCSRVVTVLAPNRKSLLHRIAYKLLYSFKSNVMRRSLKGLYDCPGNFLRAARELSAEEFDVVIVIYWQLQKMLGIFPRERTVLVTYDIDILINRQISLLERHLMKKIQAVRRWLLEQKEEIRAYRSAGHVWAITERDKMVVETIRRDTDTVDVMPYPLDVEFYAASGMKRNSREVLFLGHLLAPFNRDALDYFIRRIYPHVDDFEGLSVTIVGGDLPKELQFFGLQPDVEVVGKVPDTRPFLHRAGCLVVPLRFGGGLRIRILEAMAAGLPIVCSAEAIAGMPFEAEEHYVEAEGPEDFASQIKRVLGDPPLAARLSEAARERVEEQYGIGGQERRTVGLIRRLLVNAENPAKRA